MKNQETHPPIASAASGQGSAPGSDGKRFDDFPLDAALDNIRGLCHGDLDVDGTLPLDVAKQSHALVVREIERLEGRVDALANLAHTFDCCGNCLEVVDGDGRCRCDHESV